MGYFQYIHVFFSSLENEDKIESKLINISNIYISDNIKSNFIQKQGIMDMRKKIE